MATDSMLSEMPPDGWSHVWRDWSQEGLEPTVVLWFVSPRGDWVLSPYSQLQAAEFIDLKAFSNV